jgi:biopolymer transport protein ExbD
MVTGANTDNHVIAEINVTPLVDITLVLLVIMMVTAKIISAPAVPLELPKASKTEEVQVVFSIILAADGATLVDGARAPDDATIVAKARAAVANDSAVRAVINADGGIPHRRVLHVLDLLKTAGIARLAFGATPEDSRAQ